jgi:hypothetical protein
MFMGTATVLVIIAQAITLLATIIAASDNDKEGK